METNLNTSLLVQRDKEEAIQLHIFYFLGNIGLFLYWYIKMFPNVASWNSFEV